MFKGSMVALVTPMSGSGAIDFAALARLLDFHLDAGTDALVIGGTTGESATLTADELAELVSRTKTHVAGRIPVIAGSGTYSTASTIAQTQCARDAGADAALIVTPYYNKPTQHGLIAHFTAVADAVDIPVILYNVPGRTACDMQADTVAALAGHSRIVGIKEATGDIARTKDIIARCGDHIEVYSGDDATAKELFSAGAVGVISVTANLAPAAMHEMCQAALDSDTALAASIDARLEGLHRELFIESNPIPVKWGLQRMGLIDDGIRLPLTPLSEEYKPVVEKAMMAAGIVLD
jgi:4-hydroxy-tetrahydrodipicolinate synthase